MFDSIAPLSPALTLLAHFPVRLGAGWDVAAISDKAGDYAGSCG
jgi:hypothetical protein